jgi:hypothetical protein
MMGLEQIFGQPEEVEIPRPVAQEFGEDDGAHLAMGQQLGDAGRGILRWFSRRG